MRLSRDRLAGMTLLRQFPAVRGCGRTALLDLFDRLGPVQSQAPRAPFLTAASRLPGIDKATIRAAFDSHALLKATNLRGTVHTCRPAVFGAADAVSRRARCTVQNRLLGLADAGVRVADFVAEIEEFCSGGWRDRATLVDHLLGWLTDRRAGPASGRNPSQIANLIWGHSGLLRRPTDDRWERRTDTLHRTAVDAVGPILAPMVGDDAMITMVTSQLAAYGPATRQDVAWWSGSGLRTVDRALSIMAPELARHTGPDGEELFDLAELPVRWAADPGLRLLPEFDGLLLGYAPAGRSRFLDPVHLDRVWSRSNGTFTPVVLVDGRIGGAWRTLPGTTGERHGDRRLTLRRRAADQTGRRRGAGHGCGPRARAHGDRCAGRRAMIVA